MLFQIEYCATKITENAPFKIDRPDGSYRYIFFHFTSQVIMTLKGENIIIQPGTCILYSPQEAQKFYVEKSRLNHDFVDFICNDDSFFKKINFPVNIPFNPKDSNYISETINSILNERTETKLGHEYMEDVILTNFLVTLSRKYHHRKKYNFQQYNASLKSRFEQLRLDMYQLPDDIKVSLLAKKMGFSISRFNELYKLFFNTTPINDLTHARISRVDDLIKEGYSTKEIIKKIGFVSEEYFYRWFKKNFKTTKDNYVKKLDLKGE